MRDRVLSIIPIAPNRVPVLLQTKEQADADRKREEEEIAKHVLPMEMAVGSLSQEPALSIPDDPILLSKIETLVQEYWREHGN